MPGLRSRASDPGMRRHSSMSDLLSIPAALPSKTAKGREGSKTRILLGPHAFQCLELSEDSSCSGGEDADDEGEDDCLSSQIAEVSGHERRRDSVSSSTSSPGQLPWPPGSMRRPRSIADGSVTHGYSSPQRRSFSGMIVSTPSEDLERGCRSDAEGSRSSQESKRISTGHGPQTPPRRLDQPMIRSHSTPPVVLTAEACADWCRTQPGLEVDLILVDDDASKDETDCNDDAAKTIKRMEMLDQLFSQPSRPRYQTSMMPHAKASRRPQLSTIPSSGYFTHPSMVPDHRFSGPTPNMPMQVPPRSLQGRAPVTSSIGNATTLNFQRGSCDACDRLDNGVKKVRMIPCSHVVCSACFGSAISAVSAKSGPSKCTACLGPVESFTEAHCFNVQPARASSQFGTRSGTATGSSSQDESSDSSRERSRVSSIPTSVGTSEDEGYIEPIVMRIDNVAWDITPAVVTGFLPQNVLSTKTICPIHVLLDRFDGRTRDFLYIEVTSHASARQILQTRQNSLMPCGPLSGTKRRPVTITLVPHAELLEELRPRSAAELDSLLDLCEAAVTIPHLPTLASGIIQHNQQEPAAPNSQNSQKQRQVHDRSSGYISGVAHFVKSRHGPFYALMSALSKLGGRKSPAYWDLYRVTSGAIAALASAIDRSPFRHQARPHAGLMEDKRVLSKLKMLHQRCFSMTTPSSPE